MLLASLRIEQIVVLYVTIEQQLVELGYFDITIYFEKCMCVPYCATVVCCPMAQW